MNVAPRRLSLRHATFGAPDALGQEAGRQGRLVPGVLGGEEAVDQQPAAARGLLRVAPERAARQILAASTGVVLTLIGEPSATVDRSLSDDVRDAVMAHVSVAGAEDARRAAPAGGGRGPAAIALRASIASDAGSLSPTEVALLDDWLVRLAAT